LSAWSAQATSTSLRPHELVPWAADASPEDAEEIIAAAKAAIVAAIFMELRRRGPETFIFAAAGFFWLGILLGLMDFLTRT
jgi:hypothetical protein